MEEKNYIFVELRRDVAGFENLRAQFRSCLPYQEQFFLEPKDSYEPLTVDLVQEIISQFKLEVLPKLSISFLPDFLVVINKKQESQLIVFVGGIHNQKAEIETVYLRLQSYILKKLKYEIVSYECSNELKATFCIEAQLSELKDSSDGMIFSYNLKYENIVKVVYAKLRGPKSSWHDVKL